MSVTELLSPNGLVMAVAELKPSVSGLFGPESKKDSYNFYSDLLWIRFTAFVFQNKNKSCRMVCTEYCGINSRNFFR